MRLLLLVLAGSVFTSVSAQIAIHLPFSPVPITGQTLAVLLVGALLGARAGGAALLLYLGEGAIGLPVFAGGSGGLAVLAGPTAGYLYAFPVAAVVTGLLVAREAGRYRAAPTLLALLAGNAVLYLGGVPWLALSLHTNGARALDWGLWPFIPGDLLKLVLVAISVRGGRQILGQP